MIKSINQCYDIKIYLLCNQNLKFSSWLYVHIKKPLTHTNCCKKIPLVALESLRGNQSFPLDCVRLHHLVAHKLPHNPRVLLPPGLGPLLDDHRVPLDLDDRRDLASIRRELRDLLTQLVGHLPVFERRAEDGRPPVAVLSVFQHRVRRHHDLAFDYVHVERFQILLVIVDGVALELAEKFGVIWLFAAAAAALLVGGVHAEEEQSQEKRAQHGSLEAGSLLAAEPDGRAEQDALNQLLNVGRYLCDKLQHPKIGG